MNTIKGNEIMREYEGKLTSKAIAVFNALVRYSNKKNTCFPSLNTLHKDTGLSKSTVQRGLKELLKEGLITKKHNYRRDGSQTSNIYSIVAAVADRLKAAVENDLQARKDLEKKRAQIEENKKQTRIRIERMVNREEKELRTENRRESLIAKSLRLLKFTHLTTHPYSA